MVFFIRACWIWCWWFFKSNSDSCGIISTSQCFKTSTLSILILQSLRFNFGWLLISKYSDLNAIYSSADISVGIVFRGGDTNIILDPAPSRFWNLWLLCSLEKMIPVKGGLPRPQLIILWSYVIRCDICGLCDLCDIFDSVWSDEIWCDLTWSDVIGFDMINPSDLDDPSKSI